MRILITGSRNWNDEEVIKEALKDAFTGYATTLVSGACPTGADAMCEKIAEEMGWTVERHPADWEKYKKKAGFIRNSFMVGLGADICYAFIRDGSRGASGTAELALRNHIPLVVYRKDGDGKVQQTYSLIPRRETK